MATGCVLRICGCNSDESACVRQGAEAVMAELGSLPADPAELCKAIARIVSQTMGGSSGPDAYP